MFASSMDLRNPIFRLCLKRMRTCCLAQQKMVLATALSKGEPGFERPRLLFVLKA